MNTIPTLGFIVPCYNEEAVLNDSAGKLQNCLSILQTKGLVSPDSFICLVDDRSKDNTWAIMQQLQSTSGNIRLLRLTRNSGHQAAILAGMMEMKGHADCLITIDADLQDDLAAVEEMVKQYQSGNEIVYGVRRERNSDTFFKKQTALGFYKLMKLMGVELIYNHADFRLVGRQALDLLWQYKEVNLFLRGIFPLLGYNTAVVYYDRLDRLAGETKYPLRKMLSLAIDGITSFSVKPLRIITMLGLFISFVSFVLVVYALFAYLNGAVIKGWLSTVVPIYFIGGVQLLSIGIIGEYLGKVYKEVKGRPRYNVETNR